MPASSSATTAAGRAHLKQAVNLTAMGAASGSLWGGLLGLLVGMVFLNPLLGWLGGAAPAPARSPASSRTAASTMSSSNRSGRPSSRGTSALFVLVRAVTPEKVLPHVAKYGGTILKTSLSPEQDERIRNALAAAAT